MLTAYAVENFKAFSGPEKVALRPITLVYGPNSSGKTSLIQSLLLAKQTIDESESNDTILLARGGLVDLGGFRELVHMHDTERPLVYEFTFEPHRDDEQGRRLFFTAMREMQRIGRYRRFGMRVTIRFDEATQSLQIAQLDLLAGDSSSALVSFTPIPVGEAGLSRRARLTGRRVRSLSALRLDHVNPDHDLVRKLWTEADAIRERGSALVARRLTHLESISATDQSVTEVDVENVRTALRIQQERFASYSYEMLIEDLLQSGRRSVLRCRHFLPAEVDRTDEADDAQIEIFSLLRGPPFVSHRRVSPFLTLAVQLASMLRTELERVVYLGPLRDYPERHYVFSGNLSEHVGKSGRLAPDILYKDPDLLADVNKWLERFELDYELRVSSGPADTPELQDIYALRLFDRLAGVSASLLDVGFGISQVLPVIVQSLVSQNMLLCIEQPELHLHPRLQAELASLFAESLGEPRKNSYVIETHSEHMLLRLQRIIREGNLSPSDVGVIYVDRRGGRSTTLPLRLDQTGAFLDPWPNGFFEDGFREMF